MILGVSPNDFFFLNQPFECQQRPAIRDPGTMLAPCWHHAGPINLLGSRRLGFDAHGHHGTEVLLGKLGPVRAINIDQPSTGRISEKSNDDDIGKDARL